MLHDASAFQWAQSNPLAQAHWIWTAESNQPGDNEGVPTFTRRFELHQASSIDIAELLITASPAYEVAINRSHVGSGHVVNQVRRYDVTSLLVDGENEISITVKASHDTTAIQNGLIAAVAIGAQSNISVIVATDASWRVMKGNGSNAEPAVEQGAFSDAPWGLTTASLQAARSIPHTESPRAYWPTAASSLTLKLKGSARFTGVTLMRNFTSSLIGMRKSMHAPAHFVCAECGRSGGMP